MTRRAAVAGLLAAAGAGWVWGRARRRRPRLSVFHTVWVWATVGSILAPWDGVTDFFTDVGSQVRALVSAVVSEAVAWVEALLNAALDSVNSVFRAVWSTFSTVWGNVLAALDRVYQWAGHAIGQVYTWAASAISQVYQHIQGLFSGIMGWVAQRLGDLAGWVGGALSQLRDWAGGIIAQLWAYAHSITQWVTDHVWAPLYGLITAGLDDLRGWVADRFRDLWNLLPEPVRHIILIALQASSWLVWMATHPFDLFHQLIDDALHARPQALIDGFVRAAMREGDRLDEFIADWLG